MGCVFPWYITNFENCHQSRGTGFFSPFPIFSWIKLVSSSLKVQRLLSTCLWSKGVFKFNSKTFECAFRACAINSFRLISAGGGEPSPTSVKILFWSFEICLATDKTCKGLSIQNRKSNIKKHAKLFLGGHVTETTGWWSNSGFTKSILFLSLVSKESVSSTEVSTFLFLMFLSQPYLRYLIPNCSPLGLNSQQ